MDAHKKLVVRARQFLENKWAILERRQKYTVKINKRKRPENVKQRIVKERQFKNIRMVSGQVAEFAYQPYKCKKTYRVIVLRKNLTAEKGELALFDDIRYFFYITNDQTMTPQEIVYFANDRCDHENDIEQLKNGVNAMRMPVNDSCIQLGIHGDNSPWLSLYTHGVPEIRKHNYDGTSVHYQEKPLHCLLS